MAVKPSERTEMAAVYSSFRDVSGILTPGAGLVLTLRRWQGSLPPSAQGSWGCGRLRQSSSRRAMTCA
jgi:MFS transporter, ACDE family, multidrug resistance protein